MWWERAVVHEIYPRSFQDTDGDGVGDLRGVAGRLPYLARLGREGERADGELALRPGEGAVLRAQRAGGAAAATGAA